MGAPKDGMNTHQRVDENGYSLNVVDMNALIYMYVNHGKQIQKVRELSDNMDDGDTVS